MPAGRTEFAVRAGADALPMRDAFAVLFFVSIGMLFDPRSIVGEPLLIGIVLAVVLIGKPLFTLLTVRILRRPLSTAIPVGAALLQVGEFNFILGAVAREMKLINEAGWNAIIAAAIIPIVLNPSVYRLTRRLSSKAGAIYQPSGEPPATDPRK